jgi:hypothetical protein
MENGSWMVSFLSFAFSFKFGGSVSQLIVVDFLVLKWFFCSVSRYRSTWE